MNFSIFFGDICLNEQPIGGGMTLSVLPGTYSYEVLDLYDKVEDNGPQMDITFEYRLGVDDYNIEEMTFNLD